MAQLDSFNSMVDQFKEIVYPDSFTKVPAPVNAKPLPVPNRSPKPAEHRPKPVANNTNDNASKEEVKSEGISNRLELA
jgi:hypothetical protein